MTPPAAIPKARDDVICRQLDDEWVVFDPAANRLHVLNLTAALVWSHCTGEFALDDVIRAIADTFDSPPVEAQIAEQVRHVLGEFRQAGLLETPSS